MEGGKFNMYVVFRYNVDGSFIDLLSCHPEWRWAFTDNVLDAVFFASLDVAEKVVAGFEPGDTFLRVMECNGDFRLSAIDSFRPVTRKVKVRKVHPLSFVTCCGAKSFVDVNSSGNFALFPSNKVRDRFGWVHPLFEEPDIPF